MKLKNIELLLKNAKGIKHQMKVRNSNIEKITSFGYQLTSSETADKLFMALFSALDERNLLKKLFEDLQEVFFQLPLAERQALHQMSCKERTLKEACEELRLAEGEVRTTYRRAMRKISTALFLKGYDEFTIDMFVGKDGLLSCG